MAKEPERVWLCGGPDKVRGGAAVKQPRRMLDRLNVVMLIVGLPSAIFNLGSLIVELWPVPAFRTLAAMLGAIALVSAMWARAVMNDREGV